MTNLDLIEIKIWSQRRNYFTVISINVLAFIQVNDNALYLGYFLINMKVIFASVRFSV